jgi:FAD/FMN-containing dehydrogenase
MKNYEKFPVEPGDSRFPSFQQGFNKRWFAGSCKMVYVCHDTPGVEDALEDAIRNYGPHVRIKSGGHCYENFVFNESTLAIIDVTPMNGYGYDPEKGYYLESGGTNWSAFKGLFRDFGKVLPAGSCYSVGLGGHICGGGYGLLSRLNGLTVDWLTGVDVVVKPHANVPAYCVHASVDSKDVSAQELYWAHRGGGGGNFGVITRYYFKELPNSPASAFITQFSISWEDLNVEVLSRLLDFFADLAAGKNNWRQFGVFALHHISNKEVVMTIQTAVHAGEDPEEIKKEFIDPVIVLVERIVKITVTSVSNPTHVGGFIQPTQQTSLYTLYEAVQNLNGSGFNQRGKYKSAYMRKKFPPEQVKTILHYLQLIPKQVIHGQTVDINMGQCLLQVDTYGGKVNEMAADATAIPQRSSILKLQYQAYWSDEKNDAAYLEWIRDFYQEMYRATGNTPNPEKDPTQNVDGCYYNYPDSDLNEVGGLEGALKLYFGKNLPRLIRVKGNWDPNNYFNSFQSIPVK